MGKDENRKTNKRDNGDGCVRKRENGGWEARIQVGINESGKPKIKAFYGKTQAEVKNKLKEYKKEIAMGIHDVSTLKVTEYIDRWLRVYKFNSIKRSSYDRLESTFEHHIKNTIGQFQMGNINTMDIQLMINEKSEYLSYSSVKKIVELLSPCFRHALILGDIAKNPMLGIIMPKESTMNVKTKDIEEYTEDEIIKMRAIIYSTFNDKTKLYRYSPIYDFMLNTGLRAGEALALTWDKIDFENKIVTIDSNASYINNRESKDGAKKIVIFTDTKTKKGERLIPLNKKAIDALNEIIRRNKVQNVTSEFVVCDLNGKHLVPRNFLRTLQAINKKVGIENKSLHSLRHTFGSRALRNKIEIKVVSELLGHSNINITYNKYIHIVRQQKVEAVQSLDLL